MAARAEPSGAEQVRAGVSWGIEVGCQRGHGERCGVMGEQGESGELWREVEFFGGTELGEFWGVKWNSWWIG